MLEFLKMKVVLEIKLDILILKRSNLKIISINFNYLEKVKNKQKLREKGDFLLNFNI